MEAGAGIAKKLSFIEDRLSTIDRGLSTVHLYILTAVGPLRRARYTLGRAQWMRLRVGYLRGERR